MNFLNSGGWVGLPAQAEDRGSHRDWGRRDRTAAGIDRGVTQATRWARGRVPVVGHYFLQSPGPALTIAMLCTVSCMTRTTHAAPCSLRLALAVTVTVPLAVKRCRLTATASDRTWELSVSHRELEVTGSAACQ